MKGLKLDFKKIGMETAGNAAGLIIVHQVNQLKMLNDPAKPVKPVLKGLISLGIGRLVLPWVAGMAGMGGKKGGALLEGAGHAISTYGVGQILAATPATAKMVPAITGYEDGVYGMGLIADEEEISGVEGYEDNIYGVAGEAEGDGVFE